MKESDVPSKIVNILLVFKRKYESFFQPEERLTTISNCKMKVNFFNICLYSLISIFYISHKIVANCNEIFQATSNFKAYVNEALNLLGTYIL